MITRYGFYVRQYKTKSFKLFSEFDSLESGYGISEDFMYTHPGWEYLIHTFYDYHGDTLPNYMR